MASSKGQVQVFIVPPPKSATLYGRHIVARRGALGNTPARWVVLSQHRPVVDSTHQLD